MEAHAGVARLRGRICTFGEHHPGDSSNAEICTGCYERIQERLDVCEAALHLDLKEAAQIIYDAVWADPSDPTKTYQNAASALLTELRKRAGITAVRGPIPDTDALETCCSQPSGLLAPQPFRAASFRFDLHPLFSGVEFVARASSTSLSGTACCSVGSV